MQRRTEQREAIKRVLSEASRPLGTGEIQEEANRLCPGLGIATVYRAIRSLTEESWIVPVEIPGQPPRYELAHKPHHHHFHCRGCEKVFEVEGCVGHFADITPPGFFLESHEVILKGLCVECSGRSPLTVEHYHAHACGHAH